MSAVNRAQGEGVAVAIGAIKWVIISIMGLFAAIFILQIEFGTQLSRSWELGVAGATAVACLSVWVLFGWFEHTLLNLVRIERHTREVGWVTPGSVVDQQRRTAGL